MNHLRPCVLVMLTSCLFYSVPSLTQTIPSAADLPTYTAQARLVLVDVIPEYDNKQLGRRELLTTLQRQDFRVLDDGKEVPISAFDTGTTHGTRPIALWLIVSCPDRYPREWHSDFMRGKTQFLAPALANLGSDDVIGVAHWCDNGNASIDMAPDHDSAAALKSLEQVLDEKRINNARNRSGELAMQKMINMTLDNVHHASPDRLPVLLFFYNDSSGTNLDEADRIISNVLETSGIVFGISDNSFAFRPDSMFRGDEVGYLVHYYSQQTGGEYYAAVDPKLYAAALNYILGQMHLRYTLAFKPPILDGKKHTIKVELTKETRSQYPGVQLRFRQAYIAPTK